MCPACGSSTCAPPPKGGLVKRLAAWCSAASDAATNRLLADRKRGLLSDLRGDVLEIGPGTGANLPYLPADVRWIGVEPNTHMHGYLRRKASSLGIQIDLRAGEAE